MARILTWLLREADPIKAGQIVDFEEKEAGPSRWNVSHNIHSVDDMGDGMEAPYEGAPLPGGGGGMGGGGMPPMGAPGGAPPTDDQLTDMNSAAAPGAAPPGQEPPMGQPMQEAEAMLDEWLGPNPPWERGQQNVQQAQYLPPGGPPQSNQRSGPPNYYQWRPELDRQRPAAPPAAQAPATSAPQSAPARPAQAPVGQVTPGQAPARNPAATGVVGSENGYAQGTQPFVNPNAGANPNAGPAKPVDVTKPMYRSQDIPGMSARAPAVFGNVPVTNDWSKSIGGIEHPEAGSEKQWSKYYQTDPHAGVVSQLIDQPHPTAFGRTFSRGIGNIRQAFGGAPARQPTEDEVSGFSSPSSAAPPKAPAATPAPPKPAPTQAPAPPPAALPAAPAASPAPVATPNLAAPPRAAPEATPAAVSNLVAPPKTPKPPGVNEMKDDFDVFLDDLLRIDEDGVLTERPYGGGSVRPMGGFGFNPFSGGGFGRQGFGFNPYQGGGYQGGGYRGGYPSYGGPPAPSQTSAPPPFGFNQFQQAGIIPKDAKYISGPKDSNPAARTGAPTSLGPTRPADRDNSPRNYPGFQGPQQAPASIVAGGPDAVRNWQQQMQTVRAGGASQPASGQSPPRNAPSARAPAAAPQGGGTPQGASTPRATPQIAPNKPVPKLPNAPGAERGLSASPREVPRYGDDLQRVDNHNLGAPETPKFAGRPMGLANPAATNTTPDSYDKRTSGSNRIPAPVRPPAQTAAPAPTPPATSPPTTPVTSTTRTLDGTANESKDWKMSWADFMVLNESERPKR